MQRGGQEAYKRKHTHTLQSKQACIIRQKGSLLAASVLSESFQAIQRVILVCAAETLERRAAFISQGGVIIQPSTSPVIGYFMLITPDGSSV